MRTLFTKQLKAWVGLVWLSVVLLALLGSLPGRAQTPTWQDAFTSSPHQAAGGSPQLQDMTTDADGNIIVVGGFYVEATFGSTRLVGTGTQDIFIAKWNTSTHTWAWAIRDGDGANESANAVAVSGNAIYVTGQYGFNGTTATSTQLVGVTLTPADERTRGVMYVAKYTDTGTTATPTWLRLDGAGGGANGRDLAASGTSVYLTGNCDIVNRPGPTLTIAGTALTPAGDGDMFVAKYQDNGSTVTGVWAQAGGGVATDAGWAIALQGADVYVAGECRQGPATRIAGTPLTGSDQDMGMFVAKYHDNGSTATGQWARAEGHSGLYCDAQGLAVNGNRVYVVGGYRGAGTLATQPVTSGGLTRNAYLACYTDAGGTATPTWLRTAGGTSDDVAAHVTVQGSSVYVIGNYTNTTTNTNAVVIAGVTVPGATDATIQQDVFVAKYTDTGTTATANWVQYGGSEGNDSFCNIALVAGRVFTGHYSGAFGSAFGGAPLLHTAGFSVALGQLDAGTGAWQRIDCAQSLGRSTTTATTTDASGNVLVAGYFVGSTVFGDTTLVSASNVTTDMFVAKWSPATRTWLWAISGGGFADDQATGLAVSGNQVYVTGSFATAPGGRPVYMAGAPLHGAGDTDVFLAKLLDNGTSVSSTWVIAGGGPAADEATGVAVQGSAVYLTGSFGGTATVGGTSLSSAGSTDVFVAKYLDQGASASPAWAVGGGGTGADVARAVAVSGTSVYLTGELTSNANASLAGRFLPGAGGTDVFVAKYLDQGSTAANGWALTSGGSQDDAGYGLALSGSRLYVTGSFRSQATFGTATLGSSGNTDMFLATYNDLGTNGQAGSAQQGGGGATDVGLGVAVRGTSVYVAGTFASSATVGSTVLSSNGPSDAFLAKFIDNTSPPSAAWALSGGGTAADMGQAVTWTGNDIYLAGTVTPAAAFGSQSLANPVGAPVHFLSRVRDTATPILTSVSPGQVPEEATITLTGTGLGNVNAILLPGGIANWVYSGFTVNAAGTQITGIVVPVGTTSGYVAVSTSTPGVYTETSNGVYLEITPLRLLSTTPARHSVGSAASTNIDLTFNLPVTATRAASAVFSTRAGGKKALTTTVAGPVATLNPGTDFVPGETVSVSVPTVGKVVQFTTAVRGGTGTFASPVDAVAQSQGQNMALGDLDGDGDQDVVLLTHGSLVQVALNNSDGTFGPTQVYSLGAGVSLRHLALGDANGDGKLDVLAAEETVSNTNRVFLLPGNGNGTLQVTGFGQGAFATYIHGVADLMMADVNGDGQQDIVVALNSGAINIYLGGSPATQPPIVYGMGRMVKLRIGDIDNDGDLDMVTTNFDLATLSVFLNDGQARFTASPDVALAYRTQALELGDLDNDGDLDLVVSALGDGVTPPGTYVRLNNGNGVFSGATSLPVQFEQYNLALGDVDGDHDLDLVLMDRSYTSSTPGSYRVFRNAGDGSFTQSANIVEANGVSDVLRFGDVDNDGDLDLLTYSSGTNGDPGKLVLRRNQGGTPTLTAIAPASGPVGTTISLTGGNLGGATSISFTGGTVSTGFTVNGAGTQITGIVVPTSATTGAVTVTTPSGTSNGLTFTVTAPQLAVTQGSTSYTSGGAAYGFGAQTVNTPSAAVSFTLNNAGTAALSISNISTTGNFALSGTAPTSVAAGGSAAVGVTFTPTAAGTRPGTLVITSSLGTYTVNLSGNGQAAAPGLSSLSPTSGPVGTSVTISGLNLSGATSVSFGGNAQTTISNNTSNSLTVLVPGGATTGAVTVTTPNGTSNGLTFTVTAPQLALTQGGSSYPSNGAAYSFGTVVVGNTSAPVSFTLTNAGTAALTISSVVASGDFALSGTAPTSVAANGGTAALGVTFAPTASGSRTGTVVITSNAGTYILNLSGTGQTPAPALTSISPTSALAGSTVALTGTNLTGTYAVSFTQGATSRSVTSGYTVSSTSITGIVVPASLSPGAYMVYASNLNGVSNGIAFTVLAPAPSVTSFSVDYGIVGEVITINGTNLVGATSVNVGGVSQPTITNNTGTSLTFAVPTGAITGPVTVTTPGGTSNGLVFHVLRDLTVSTGTVGSPVVIALEDYRNIVITGTGAAVLQTEAVVFGSLTVQAGGSLNTNCGAVTGTGSFTLAAGATLAICDANGLRAIGNSGPVRVTGSRSFSTGAHYVYNGSGAQETGSGLPATVRSLTTVNNNPVTLSLPVSISQTLTIGATGSLNLAGQALTLLSDAIGTALVVNSGTGVVTGGTATVQRYLTPTNPGLGYRHYASPVRGNTLADLQTGTFIPVFNTAYNTSAQPNMVTPFPTVFGYDQARVAGPASTYSGFDKGWYSPATGPNTPTAFTVGQGYSVNLLGTEKVDFTGTLNTGTYAVNLARTTGPTAAVGGWALVGNPYPAPIDWTRIAASDRPGLDASIYVYESSSAYGGAYRSYVNGVGSGSPLIGTAQGFWVQVSSGQTAGMLTFRDAHRLTSYATQAPMRRTAADTRPQLQLTLAGAGLTDDMYLYAEPGATAAVDAAFDATKLLNPHGLNVATLTTAGPALAIDGRADLSTATTIALQVGVPAAGRYNFTAAALQNLPPGTTLVLVDAVANSRTVLTAGANYAFTTTATTLPGRFFLNLVPAGALGTAGNALAAQVLLYPSPAHGTATLQVPAGLRTGPAVLLNALGQTVRTLPLTSASTTVDLRGLAAGVYSLRLMAATGTVTRRLVVE